MFSIKHCLLEKKYRSKMLIVAMNAILQLYSRRCGPHSKIPKAFVQISPRAVYFVSF